MYTHLVSPANRQQLRHCRGRRVVCMRCINNTCTAHVLSEILSSRTGLPPDLADKPAGCSAYARRWLAIRAPAGASVPHAVRTYVRFFERTGTPSMDRCVDLGRRSIRTIDRSMHPSRTSGRIGATTYRFARAACAWSSTWRRFIFGAHVRTCERQLEPGIKVCTTC